MTTNPVAANRAELKAMATAVAMASLAGPFIPAALNPVTKDVTAAPGSGTTFTVPVPTPVPTCTVRIVAVMRD